MERESIRRCSGTIEWALEATRSNAGESIAIDSFFRKDRNRNGRNLLNGFEVETPLSLCRCNIGRACFQKVCPDCDGALRRMNYREFNPRHAGRPKILSNHEQIQPGASVRCRGNRTIVQVRIRIQVTLNPCRSICSGRLDPLPGIIRYRRKMEMELGVSASPPSISHL